MLACDERCQDCKQRMWKVALSTVRGYVYFCGRCAAEFIFHREKNSKQYRVKLDKACKVA